MLTEQEILNAAEPGNILQGSVLATLQSKLLSGAVGVLFGLLGKLNDQGVHQRRCRISGQRGVPAVPPSVPHRRRQRGVLLSGPGRLHHGHSGGGHEALGDPVHPEPAVPGGQKGGVPGTCPNEALTAAYPGRCQSLTQVLSTADARLSGLTEKTR